MVEKKQVAENDEGILSRLFGLAAIATGIAVGAGLLGSGGWKLSQWWRVGENVEIQATVLETRIDSIRSTNNKTGAQQTKYEPYVVFGVPLDGRTHRATVRLASCWDMDEAMGLLERFPPESTAQVYIHPESPEEVFLDNDLPLGGPLFMVIFGVILVACCGYGAVISVKSVFGRPKTITSTSLQRD